MPDLSANVERILLVRTDRISDAVVSTAFFKALRDRFPDAQIDIVLGRKNGAAAPLLPYLDGVFVAQKNLIEQARLIRQLRERRYDLAVDMLTGDSMTAAAYAVLSGADVTIGFDGKAAGLYDVAIAQPTEPEHQAVRTLRLIAPLDLAVKPEDARTIVVFPPSAAERIRETLFPSGRNGEKLVVVNLSADLARSWDDEKFSRLIADIKSPSVRVALMSAQEDAARLETIGKAAGVEWLPPLSGLSEVAAALSCADLVISAENSIVHIAAALGKPVVTLAEGDRHSDRHPYCHPYCYPWGVPYRVLQGATRVADIPYDKVLSAVRDLMAETGVAKPTPSIDGTSP